ncbi:22279_t:CDS:2, partial [Gigaspora rosea]
NYSKEIALVLPVIIRWGTHLDCIKTLIESQTAIQQMIYDQTVHLNPSTWWSSWPLSELQKLAIRILSILTLSASAEHNYSNFRYIHSKTRNRLKNEQVKKLVYIYSNLRMHYTKKEHIIEYNKNKNIEVLGEEDYINNKNAEEDYIDNENTEDDYINNENAKNDFNLNNDNIFI